MILTSHEANHELVYRILFCCAAKSLAGAYLSSAPVKRISILSRESVDPWGVNMRIRRYDDQEKEDGLRANEPCSCGRLWKGCRRAGSTADRIEGTFRARMSR